MIFLCDQRKQVYLQLDLSSGGCPPPCQRNCRTAVSRPGWACKLAQPH